MKRLVVLMVALTLALTPTGCEKYVPPPESSNLGSIERDYVLVFVLDTSGSFIDRMFGRHELGFKFFMRSVDRYFRNRMGEHDRVLISQLSANNRTLLWEGSPLNLRRRFGDSAAVKQFIAERSDPSGSRVYAALADTLNYVQTLPGVSDGKTEVCVLVLSDLIDTSPNPEEDKKRMIDALAQYGQTGGSMGLYWVDQLCLSDCRQWLADAGIKQSIVECEILDDPPLPFAEQ